MNVRTAIAIPAAALFLSLPPPAALAEEEIKIERETIIESERLSVVNDGEEAYFLFTGNVEVQATNMLLQSDRLEVFATREADIEPSIGRHGAIKRILATGNVRIEQAERVATAGQAEVLVEEERILLTENPVVTQAGGRLTGPELVIERGAGRVVVKGSAQHRVRLTGPVIRDFGFERDSGQAAQQNVDPPILPAAAQQAPETEDPEAEPTEPEAPDAEAAEDPQPDEQPTDQDQKASE